MKRTGRDLDDNFSGQPVSGDRVRVPDQRQQNEEIIYDEDFFLQNPSALEEYQQMPIDFQQAFFRKHKDWIKKNTCAAKATCSLFAPTRK